MLTSEQDPPTRHDAIEPSATTARTWWRRPFDHLSIGVQVFVFVGVLAAGVSALSYESYVRSAQHLIRSAQSDRLAGSAQVALARIDAESRVLMHTARSLARHPRLQEFLGGQTPVSGAAVRVEMERMFDSAGVSALELIDAQREPVVHLDAPGDVSAATPAWGIEEALAGTALTQTSKETGGGLMLRALVPVRAQRDDSVLGVVAAATRFDDAFARRIGQEGALELAIATPLGLVARSSPRLSVDPAVHRAFVERCLFERVPVLAFDLAAGDLRQYVPLELGDEVFVLIMQGDAAAAQAQVLDAAREALRSSVLMLGAAMALACFFAMHLGRRLKHVRAQAEALARDVTGSEHALDHLADGLDTQPVRSELVVLEKVFTATSKAVSRHHDAIRQAKEMAEHAANYDALTGLPNRAFLMKEIARHLHSHPDEEWALLFLDLDGFKRVNDKLGHDVGDALLSQAAVRLMKIMGSRESVARLGGDEFVLIARQTGQLSAPVLLAQQLIDSLEQPFLVDARHLINVSASVGIAWFPHHGCDASTLLKSADLAMYEAKGAGRRSVRTYQPTATSAS
ncbi:MAG: GGDEF domain-containing protein [Burkholderiaceae bacterium]|nr:GGDEF domain-containing protein [Burkholderiaceae bacterium]